MKLTTQIKILGKLLNRFNHKEIQMKNTTNALVKHNYWDKECLDHPTNNSCLIYCD